MQLSSNKNLLVALTLGLRLGSARVRLTFWVGTRGFRRCQSGFLVNIATAAEQQV